MPDADVLLDVRPGTRYVVVDLEATCWASEPPAPNEIIEIGAVAYEAGPGVRGEFQTFVRPKLKPVLSEFCRGLTHIRQKDVDGAPPFPEAFASFWAWAGRYQPFLFVSWGAYDRSQFEADCALHGVPYPFANHVNLKTVFAAAMECKPCGLYKAMGKISLPVSRAYHRGIDDARGVAAILDALVRRGSP